MSVRCRWDNTCLFDRILIFQVIEFHVAGSSSWFCICSSSSLLAFPVAVVGQKIMIALLGDNEVSSISDRLQAVFFYGFTEKTGVPSLPVSPRRFISSDTVTRRYPRSCRAGISVSDAVAVDSCRSCMRMMSPSST